MTNAGDWVRTKSSTDSRHSAILLQPVCRRPHYQQGETEHLKLEEKDHYGCRVTSEWTEWKELLNMGFGTMGEKQKRRGDTDRKTHFIWHRKSKTNPRTWAAKENQSATWHTSEIGQAHAATRVWSDTQSTHTALCMQVKQILLLNRCCSIHYMLINSRQNEARSEQWDVISAFLLWNRQPFHKPQSMKSEITIVEV